LGLVNTVQFDHVNQFRTKDFFYKPLLLVSDNVKEALQISQIVVKHRSIKNSKGNKKYKTAEKKEWVLK
jgi:hypothetical protein